MLTLIQQNHMNMAKKYVTINEHHSVTRKDGTKEERDTRKTVVLRANDDPFYIVYYNFIDWMYDLHSDSCRAVMQWLMEHAEYNTGRVRMTTDDRYEITRVAHITRFTLTAAIDKLIANGAIKREVVVDTATGEERIAKSTYIINPFMFWKGELSKRNALKVIFEADYDTSSDIETNETVADREEMVVGEPSASK